MNETEEIKPGMYAEDISEEKRKEEYTLSEEDLAELRDQICGQTVSK